VIGGQQTEVQVLQKGKDGFLLRGGNRPQVGASDDSVNLSDAGCFSGVFDYVYQASKRRLNNISSIFHPPNQLFHQKSLFSFNAP
jgi:hypothetical protein